MKVLFLGVLCGLFGVCGEQPLRQLTTHATPFAHSAVPLFRHGYLVLFPPGGVSGTPVSAMFYGQADASLLCAMWTSTRMGAQPSELLL